MIKWTAATAAIVLMATAGFAHAGTERLAWSTYMRAGPGENYAVVDELEHDTDVDVRQCNDRWCEIVSGQVVGYIDRDALTLPKPPGGNAPVGGPQGCFTASLYSYGTNGVTRFCQTEPEKH
jgi:hypothetical protein